MNPEIAKNSFMPGTSRGRRSARTLALQMAMEAEKQAAVARRLKELRGARTQQPIADYVGVTLRAYQAWEAGDSGISWPHIEKLAKYHKVSENFILYGDDAGPRQPTDQLDRIEAELIRQGQILDALREARAIETEEAAARAAKRARQSVSGTSRGAGRKTGA